MGSPSRRFAAGLVAATALLAALTRLPQFLGGHVLVDGDESVVGLMAKHLSEGRRWPVFFYGQDYGFSFVEAALGAAAFRIAGVSTESLKAAMLVLWALGVVFLALAAERWGGRCAAVATAIALVFCPGWAAWSLKARGGYVTAFAASGVALWLLAGAEREPRRARTRWTFLGVVAGVAAAAQPIALVALVPFFASALLPRDRRRQALPLLASALATVGVVAALSLLERTHVWTPPLLDHPDPVAALLVLPRRVFVSLSGSHFFGRAVDAGPWTRCAAALWAAALIGLGIRSIRILRGREYGDPSLLCVAGALGVSGLSLLVAPQQFAQHYLFPVPGLVVLGAALAWARWPAGNAVRRATAVAGLGAIVLLGAGSLLEFRRLALCGFVPSGGMTEPELMRSLLGRLESEGVGHVYCDSPMLQWTITFVSRERILARWRRAAERFPEYAPAVDAALRAGRPVAMVFVRNPESARPPARLLRENPGSFSLGETFHVLPRVSIETVRAAGFRLGPRRAPQ